MPVSIGEYTIAVKELASRMKLFYDRAHDEILRDFDKRFQNDQKFKDQIESLAKETNQEIGCRFKEKFAHKTVMTLMLKVIFIRLAEDKGLIKPPYFTKRAMEEWENTKTRLEETGETKHINTLIELLDDAYKTAGRRFKGLFLYSPYDYLRPNQKTIKVYLVDALKDEPTSAVYKGKGGFDFATMDPRVISGFYEKLFDRKKRKALGFFFTPPVIAEYLVEKAFEGQKITEDFLVLDPACGSGQILLAAYKKLKDIFTKKYSMSESEAHKRILTHNLWGVDIEPFAVLLSKIALTIQEMDVSVPWINVIHGDSLLEHYEDEFSLVEGRQKIYTQINGQRTFVKEDLLKTKKYREETLTLPGGKTITFYRDEAGRVLFERPVEQQVLLELVERMETGIHEESEIQRTMADVSKLEFDAVVANPPYVSAKFLLRDYKNLISPKFESAFKIYDLYVLFVEKGIRMLKEKGKLSYIMPNKFMASDYGKKIRELILNKTEINELLDVSFLDIFEDSSAYPVILTLTRISPDDKLITAGVLLDLKKLRRPLVIKIKQSTFKELGVFVALPPKKLQLLIKIFKNHKLKQLKQLVRPSYRPLGFTDWSDLLWVVSPNIPEGEFVKFIGATNIEPYLINWQSSLTLGGYNFLQTYLPRVSKTEASWSELTSKKLLVKEVAKNLTVAIDGKGEYGHITGIYALIQTDAGFNLKYILLLLNSKLLKFFYTSLFGALHLAGGYLRFNWSFLKKLPIYPATKAQQRPFIQMADKMLNLNKKLQELQVPFKDFVDQRVKKKVPLREIKEADFIAGRDSQAKLTDKDKFETETRHDQVIVNIRRRERARIIGFTDSEDCWWVGKYLDGLGYKNWGGDDSSSWVEKILATPIPWPDKPTRKKIITDYRSMVSERMDTEKEIEETDKRIDGMVYKLYGISKKEREIIEKLDL